MNYRPLYNLRVGHDYFDRSVCRALRCRISPAEAELWRRRGLLFRQLGDNGWTILYDSDGAGVDTSSDVLALEMDMIDHAFVLYTLWDGFRPDAAYGLELPLKKETADAAKAIRETAPKRGIGSGFCRINIRMTDKLVKAARDGKPMTCTLQFHAPAYRWEYQTQMLAHCGEMMNRFAILDVQPKAAENETMDVQINTFRTNVGANFLSYGAAYYPWLNTSVLSDKDIDGSVLTWNFKLPAPDVALFFDEKSKFPEYFKQTFEAIAGSADSGQQTESSEEADAENKEKDTQTDKPNGKALNDNEVAALKTNLHNAMLQNFPGYQYIVNKVKDKLNLLPPSAAMAGLYTMVDNTRGVWKAPANVSVNYVNSPQETIDNAQQEDLNMPMNGKAVNAIRTFPGEGIKVWGARTLDGNSQDWKYVNVRRTMMFLEESVKNAAKAYVFEPNVAATWMNVRSMIDNFLRGVWKRGGLAGSTPEDAYEIHVGLGDTMTANDILDGIMRITVLVAITRPAEFIEITFQQQMQKS